MLRALPCHICVPTVKIHIHKLTARTATLSHPQRALQFNNHLYKILNSRILVPSLIIKVKSITSPSIKSTKNLRFCIIYYNNINNVKVSFVVKKLPLRNVQHSYILPHRIMHQHCCSTKYYNNGRRGAELLPMHSRLHRASE